MKVTYDPICSESDRICIFCPIIYLLLFFIKIIKKHIMCVKFIIELSYNWSSSCNFRLYKFG